MMKIIGIITLLTCLSFQTLAATAKVYVWVNEKGVLVYSDTPIPGAEEVKVKPSNRSSSIDTSVLDITPQKLDNTFTVEITQPENHETIRDNTGSVSIYGRIKPVFKQGLQVQLYFDGKKFEKPQKRAMYILRNIDRGEHQIKIELIDNKGKVIASSAVTNFYMHRMSVIKAK